MSSPRSLPEDPRLAAVVEQLRKSRAAIELYDSEWRLVWLSDELKRMLGETDEEKLGLGKHMLEAVCLNELWSGPMTPDSFWDQAQLLTPVFLHDTPGGAAALADIAERALRRWTNFSPGVTREEIDAVFAGFEPATPPPVLWSTYARGDPASRLERTDYFAVRLHDDEGEFFGTMMVNTVGLPASLIALLARGDEATFARMARLSKPGRRRAAIMFADLQASMNLSRRLPTPSYFDLMGSLVAAIDDIVVRRGGVVGKHAGDGVTGFFIVDELGSDSSACHAAIEAAREISSAADEVFKSLGDRLGGLNGSVAVNVGLHWSATLYMGQLVTGGRLEVTALGDEVNECARIQDAAQDGAVLASKVLVEHLDETHATALGLDLRSLRYLPLAELPDASPKAVSDAGSLPVTVLWE